MQFSKVTGTSSLSIKIAMYRQSPKWKPSGETQRRTKLKLISYSRQQNTLRTNVIPIKIELTHWKQKRKIWRDIARPQKMKTKDIVKSLRNILKRKNSKYYNSNNSSNFINNSRQNTTNSKTSNYNTMILNYLSSLSTKEQ